MTFKKATKEKSKLRLALIGPTGSGKTYSALAIAEGLGDRVAVIDTERGSASKYAGIFNFDVLELETFSVENYMAAIAEAVKAKYDVLVIDSLSHAWAGKDGILEFIDKKSAANPGGSSFMNWRSATPLHNKFVDSILAAPLHVIATMRSKTEWVVEKDDRGKSTPRKVGLAPVQRDGVEYEFDVIGDMTPEHRLVVSKSRIPGLADDVLDKPGRALGERLRAWLEEGNTPTSQREIQLAAPAPKPEPKRETPVPTPTPVEPAPPAESEGFTVEQAHDFIPAKTGQYAGMRLRDYPTELLGTVISSSKASDRLRQMAYVVLEMREAGDAAPEETIAPEPEQEVQQPLA